MQAFDSAAQQSDRAHAHPDLLSDEAGHGQQLLQQATDARSAERSAVQRRVRAERDRARLMHMLAAHQLGGPSPDPASAQGAAPSPQDAEPSAQATQDAEPSAPAAEQPAHDPMAVAEEALTGSATALPYAAQLGQALGRDFSDVRAHLGTPQALAACAALSAEAFVYRGQLVCAEPGPSLELVAHEAAHIDQQLCGVVADGYLSQPGDPLELQADAVAQAVCASQSLDRAALGLAPLTDAQVSAAQGVQMRAIQRSFDPQGKALELIADQTTQKVPSASVMLLIDNRGKTVSGPAWGQGEIANVTGTLSASLTLSGVALMGPPDGSFKPNPHGWTGVGMALDPGALSDAEVMQPDALGASIDAQAETTLKASVRVEGTKTLNDHAAASRVHISMPQGCASSVKPSELFVEPTQLTYHERALTTPHDRGLWAQEAITTADAAGLIEAMFDGLYTSWRSIEIADTAPSQDLPRIADMRQRLAEAANLAGDGQHGWEQWENLRAVALLEQAHDTGFGPTDMNRIVFVNTPSTAYEQVMWTETLPSWLKVEDTMLWLEDDACAEPLYQALSPEHNAAVFGAPRSDEQWRHYLAAVDAMWSFAAGFAQTLETELRDHTLTSAQGPQEQSNAAALLKSKALIDHLKRAFPDEPQIFSLDGGQALGAEALDDHDETGASFMHDEPLVQLLIARSREQARATIKPTIDTMGSYDASAVTESFINLFTGGDQVDVIKEDEVTAQANSVRLSVELASGRGIDDALGASSIQLIFFHRLGLLQAIKALYDDTSPGGHLHMPALFGLFHGLRDLNDSESKQPLTSVDLLAGLDADAPAREAAARYIESLERLVLNLSQRSVLEPLVDDTLARLGGYAEGLEAREELAAREYDEARDLRIEGEISREQLDQARHHHTALRTAAREVSRYKSNWSHDAIYTAGRINNLASEDTQQATSNVRDELEYEVHQRTYHDNLTAAGERIDHHRTRTVEVFNADWHGPYEHYRNQLNELTAAANSHDVQGQAKAWVENIGSSASLAGGWLGLKAALAAKAGVALVTPVAAPFVLLAVGALTVGLKFVSSGVQGSYKQELQKALGRLGEELASRVDRHMKDPVTTINATTNAAKAKLLQGLYPREARVGARGHVSFDWVSMLSMDEDEQETIFEKMRVNDFEVPDGLFTAYHEDFINALLLAVAATLQTVEDEAWDDWYTKIW